MGKTILIALTVAIVIKVALLASLVVAQPYAADDMVALAPINVAADWR